MSIFVTGGTGFIGTQVVRTLLEEGKKDIVIFDIHPARSSLRDVEDQIELVEGDLGNISHVLNTIKALPKVTYHLGGMLSTPSDTDPAAAFRANAIGAFHVPESANHRPRP